VTTTINLAKGLADKGHKICIIAPKHRKMKEFSYPNVTVKRIAGIPALFYQGFKITPLFSIAILNYLKKEKIDIIHFQTPLTLGFQAILIAKFLKKPLVGTFHTFITDAEYIKHAGIQNELARKFCWYYVKNYYNKCNMITCPSESAKQELMKNGFIKPIKVISNGIDFSIFDNSGWKKMKKKYNPNGKILLFVGRIAYEKNLDYLIECFELVLKKDPSVKLVIVGDGPQIGELKTKIKELGLSGNVVLTGRIEHDALVRSGIFKASDIFITASTTESQGISTLEAQTNGLVCVGLNARGIKDLIRNNYNGYLVKYGDKRKFANRIVKLLDDDKTYERMRRNTLKEIRKHDIKSIIKVWEEKYLHLIG
ncbi:MAG: glycosyltransferase, partial [Candidatus Woesearchaeota archaeon]|nr:glycosyltransferase [Candidatus Woesearchaeota archaeon]